MTRKITKSWDYWFLTKGGRAVWVNVKTNEILVEHEEDHKLHKPTEEEENEIIVQAIFNSIWGV